MGDVLVVFGIVLTALLIVLLGAFAIGAIAMCVLEWRRTSSLSLHISIVALSSLVVLAWLALVLDLIWRRFGSTAGLYSISSVSMLVACFATAIVGPGITYQAWARGKPKRAGALVALITFAVFFASFIPLIFLVRPQPSSRETALFIILVIAAAMAVFVGSVTAFKSREAAHRLVSSSGTSQGLR